MRSHPETIRAFLLRTTALYSGVVQAPVIERPSNGTFTVYSKGRQGKKVQTVRA